MTINDGWAKASVRLIGSPLGFSDLPTALGACAEFGNDGTVTVFPIADDQDLPLQELLSGLETFLAVHEKDLVIARRGGNTRLEIFLGWSPKAPQDSLSFSARLVALLHEQHGEIVIDTYSD